MKHRLRANAITLILTFALLLGSLAFMPTELTYAASSKWYVKPAYPDYAPSGMPDFDQKQDAWGPGPGIYTWCGPVAVANSLWWLDSKFDPSNLVTAYPGAPGDHDPLNVDPLVRNLAFLMDTDGQRTLDGHLGTRWQDLENGVKNYIAQQGLTKYFEVHNQTFPDFNWISTEILASQDVELFLEFYQYTPTGWMPLTSIPSLEAGHFVTGAGVNTTTSELLISDPYQDAFEAGTAPKGGLSPVSHLYPHPPMVHNNASYVSQDAYQTAQYNFIGNPPPPPPPNPPLGYPPFALELKGYLQTMGFDATWHTFVRAAVATSPKEVPEWHGYVKPSYPDYAPSGVPDFDQKQDHWGPGPGTYTWCGPVSVANSLWWFDSKYESLMNPAPVPPPAISDHFALLTAYGQWDDHDARNLDPFVGSLAFLMDADGMRTGLVHTGTNYVDMETGISQYLQQKGINPVGDCDGDGDVDQADIAIINAAMGSVPGAQGWNMAADIVLNNAVDIVDLMAANANLGLKGMFYEHTEEFPDFHWVEDEVYRCEDVILFLEFWQFTGSTWIKLYDNPSLEAGHYVTAAGVNSTTLELLISDPYHDAFEAGLSPGRSPIAHPFPHPATVHNDTQFVSHDAYGASQWVEPPPSPYPGIPVWELLGYLQALGYNPSWHAFVRAAVVTSPLGVHDVAVTGVTTSKAGCTPKPTVCQGYSAIVNVTVENQGDFQETFQLTATAADLFTTYNIGQTIVTLNSAEVKTLTFIWDTTGYAINDYTVGAVAATVAGEVDTLDNSFSDGTLTVTYVGDLNADGLVDIFDIVMIAVAFGSTPNDPNWNPNSDINGDNLIDIFDIVIVALHFGESGP